MGYDCRYALHGPARTSRGDGGLVDERQGDLGTVELGVELLVFGGAAVALWAIDRTTAAEAFAGIAAANLALVYALGL